MKRIALVHERTVSSAETGTHCPVSGIWVPEEDPQNEQFIPEGSILPSVNGQATVWRRRSGRAVRIQTA
ncbi:hypothetical protein [Arthrobacter sp. NPDC090010]|uniref:hypothetical protein n=1 Tax=Arthrobacter sp. NPDC090010 TaxID=3363942 RepID=UPI003812AD96